MRRIAMAAGLTLVFSMASLGQEAGEDARQKSLSVATKWTGKKIQLTGTVDMPDGCILQISLQEEPERMLHSKVECRLQPSTTPSPNIEGVLVSRKKFQGTIEIPAPGFYRYTIFYSQFAQRDQAVIQALGRNYGDWARHYALACIDPKDVVSKLEGEVSKLKDYVKDLSGIADTVDAELKQDLQRRNFNSIHKEINALEKKVQAYKTHSYYSATVDVILEALQKMRNASPEVPKLNFEPGSADAEHAASGFQDIPEAINDTWQMELIRAYVSRAGRCIERERLLVPLRYATSMWEEYLGAIRFEKIDEKSLDAARDNFDAAFETVKQNSKTIVEELPEEKQRKGEQQVMAEWCKLCVEVFDDLDSFALKRRGARESSSEERRELDTTGEKEVRQKLEALNTAIRKVPSR